VKQLQIYLDTSVISFVFADDAPELRKVTLDFFQNYVGTDAYRVYVSDTVIREIDETPDHARRAQLLGVVRDYHLRVLSLTPEAERLAHVYVEDGVMPASKIDDARHVAIATCNQLDILLSWNFKHLANIRKQIAVRVVNVREGYFYPLTLTNPMEVLYERD
jgi:hypothetical protein